MVIELTDKQQKYQVAKEILTELPEWFGMPDSIEEYAKESMNNPVIAEQLADGTIIGFFTLKETRKETCELYVCGIRKEYHRQGIGRRLYQRMEEICKEAGYQYLQVKTLAPEVKDPYYLKSVAFYKNCGFAGLEVLPLWDEWNPCLVLVKYIGK